MIRRSLLATSVGLTFVASTALADPPSALAPLPGEEQASPATPEDLLHRAYLTDDPGHYRTNLEKKGIKFDLQYVNDYFGIASGSTPRGHDTDFGRVRFTLDIDFGKLASINGLSFHFTGVNQTGGNADPQIGGYANPSSIDGHQTSRVDSFWLQQKLFNGVVVIRVGQLAQQDNYGEQEYGGSFLVEPIGYAFSNLFSNVFATFDPAGKPGVELQIHPYGGFYIKSMYQKGNENPYGPEDEHGLGFDTGGQGTLATEIGWRYDDPTDAPLRPKTGGAPKDGKDAKDGKSAPSGQFQDGPRIIGKDMLPAVYKFGMYNSFADFTDLRNGYTIHDNYLLYGMLNQALFRESHYGPGFFRGLDAFVGVDGSPDNVSLAWLQVEGGLLYRGPIPGRDKDTLGVAVVYTDFSNKANTPASIVANGFYTDEKVVEVNYACQVTGWFLVQPVFQYHMNPGGNNLRDDAVLLGVRTKVVF
jgi:porin